MTHSKIREWITADTNRDHTEWEDKAKLIIIQLLDELDGKIPIRHDTTNMHGFDFLKVGGRKAAGIETVVKISPNESMFTPPATGSYDAEKGFILPENGPIRRNWNPEDFLDS